MKVHRYDDQGNELVPGKMPASAAPRPIKDKRPTSAWDALIVLAILGTVVALCLIGADLWKTL